MIFWGKSLLNTLMQIFIMLRHLVAEISRFKFDDYRVIRTRASDLKLFMGGVSSRSFSHDFAIKLLKYVISCRAHFTAHTVLDGFFPY